MPGNYLNIDINFPTFTGRESSREQVGEMLNYLRQLVDQLRYTLNNLEEKNFNRTGLNNILENGTADIREQTETLAAALQQTNGNVASLSGRVANLEGLPNRMDRAEGNITAMQQTLTEHGQALTDQAAAIADQATAITGLTQAVQTLISVISVSGSNVTIGGSGVRVDLNGNVYINGQAQ